MLSVEQSFKWPVLITAAATVMIFYVFVDIFIEVSTYFSSYVLNLQNAAKSQHVLFEWIRVF